MFPWLSQNRKYIQLGLLILLAASFLAPWTFNGDGVPPPEWCEAPNVLLTPDSCVRLVPGYEMAFVGLRFLTELFMGGLTAQVNLSEALNGIVIILVLVLPLLPVMVLLWQVLHAERALSRSGRIFFYLSLLLGFIAALLPSLTNWPPRATLLWGMWLYVILADIVFLLDLLSRVGNRNSPQPLTV